MRIFILLGFGFLMSCASQSHRLPAQESVPQENQLHSNEIQLARVANTGNAKIKSRYTKKYSFSLCGISSVQSPAALLIGQEFRIYSDMDITGQAVKLQNDNCLYWENSVSYKGDVPVNLALNYLIFTTQGPRKNIRKTAMLNPWINGSGSQPEFFDYTRFGIPESLRKEKWAFGAHEIQLALDSNLYGSAN